MTKRILSIFSFLLFSAACIAQNADNKRVLTDGFYIAKTGGVAAAKIEIFTYLKFYEDGTVYLQSVSSFDPESVAKWFGRDKTFSQKGTYKVEENEIVIEVNNKGTEDAKLEGAIETKYRGYLKSPKTMCLLRDEEKEEKCFKFSKVSE